MRLHISGPPALVTEALSAQIKQRLGLALGRFAPRLGPVKVRVSRREGQVHCEIDVGLRARTVHIEETDLDVSRAVEYAIGRVDGPVARAIDRDLDR
jgi:ribosome-associated translation inhibitor RaiA